MRKDPVTPEVRMEVLIRDQNAMRASLMGRWDKEQAVLLMRGHPICVAPIIDPTQWESCWGRSTLDHIKDQPRMALRAPSNRAHLVALCQGHSEDGRKAGYQWNTHKVNRNLLRAYLALQQADGSIS